MRRVGLELGESWVVEGEEGNSEVETEQKTEHRAATPLEQSAHDARRIESSTASTPDPEFVMPRLDSNSMDGSWSHSKAGAVHRPDPIIPSPEPRNTRRRAITRRLENRDNPERHNIEKSRSEGSRRLKRRDQGEPNDRSREAADETFILNTLTGSAVWCIDVLGKTLYLMKTPISFFLAAVLVLGLAFVARTLIWATIYTSLSSICRVPGASFLSLPFCSDDTFAGSHRPKPPVEFKELMAMQSRFEDVLKETSKNVGLPMELKRGETSLRDLRQLVKYSNILSKNELELEFDDFIDTAKITSYDLQKFNSHVGRAVDSVIATTRWTNRILDNIQVQDSSRGLVSNLFDNRLLALFQPVRYTEKLLLDQYIKHTQIVEEEINKLIVEAQALLMVLNSLDDKLDVIHGIVTRDQMHAKAKREEILADLWTIVGGNRGKLSNMNKQLGLLQEIGKYRKSAYTHVSGTIMKLQTIAAGLEDLRERVGLPAVLRDRFDVPLSVHMENIQRGVERLDEARQNARKVENERIRMILERDPIDTSLIE